MAFENDFFSKCIRLAVDDGVHAKAVMDRLFEFGCGFRFGSTYNQEHDFDLDAVLGIVVLTHGDIALWFRGGDEDIFANSDTPLAQLDELHAVSVADVRAYLDGARRARQERNRRRTVVADIAKLDADTLSDEQMALLERVLSLRADLS